MGESMKETTITIKFTCQESLEQMPNIYIRNFEEAITANSHREKVLKRISIDLVELHAVTEKFLHELRTKKVGKAVYYSDKIDPRPEVMI